MIKKKVAVLFGGCSPEYSVSLASASAIIRHFDRDRYEPVLIGINRQGKWLLYTGEVDGIESDQWESEAHIAVMVSPDRNEKGIMLIHNDRTERMQIDIAFPILHGANGEDGTVQGVFELAGIPIAGCGTLSSALCMDKKRAHQMAETIGVKTAKSFVIDATSTQKEVKKQLDHLTLPVYVKPVHAGSSFGITRVNTRNEIEKALRNAFEFDTQAIVEEEVKGIEVGCAVMGNEKPVIGEVDEIELSDGFFDYSEKYNLVTSKIHVPARITVSKAKEIKEAALRIYHILGCKGFARLDFFLDMRGQLFFNEANTIPGFTTHSRFPGMMRAAGYRFEEVVEYILDYSK